MQIEAGKYYRTRDGRKVGPIARSWQEIDDPWPYFCEGLYYKPNGYSCHGIASDHDDKDDLIAEWQDEPKTMIDKLTFNVDYDPDHAALAAQHRIKITVQVGEVLIEYDGRV